MGISLAAKAYRAALEPKDNRVPGRRKPQTMEGIAVKKKGDVGYNCMPTVRVAASMIAHGEGWDAVAKKLGYKSEKSARNTIRRKQGWAEAIREENEDVTEQCIGEAKLALRGVLRAADLKTRTLAGKALLDHGDRLALRRIEVTQTVVPAAPVGAQEADLAGMTDEELEALIREGAKE